jgi:hypothetical protein
MPKSKEQRRATEQGRRERAAAARSAHLRAERRRRLVLSAVSIVAVLAVVGGIVAAAVLGGGSKKAQAPSGALSAGVRAAVTGVPAGTLNAVGQGSAGPLIKPAKGTHLTADGKPQVLYVGAEYCPYCAAERWAMVVALSRFGSFDGLTATHSSAVDQFPNTATFSFHGAQYTSPYVSFVGKELNTNQVQGNGYAPLDTLTPAEQREFDALNTSRSFPFVDFAGRYLLDAAQYDPGLLQGKTMSQIAGKLADPKTAEARAIDGSANTLTAVICKLTAGKPAAVCASPTIAGLAGRLDAAK